MIPAADVHGIMARHTVGDGMPIVADLDRSHGSWLVDARTGRGYLDCFTMHAAQPLGWNYPKLIMRADRLADVAPHNVANSDCYTQVLAEFVGKFAAVTPDFCHHFFISGGALGVENALKAAFDWKSQKLGYGDTGETDHSANLDVVHLREAFHGRSGYTLSVTNTGAGKIKWFPKFPWTRVDNPKMDWDAEGDVAERENESLRQAEVALQTGRVAAILLETIQGEGGDNHFRTQFLTGLRRLADQYEALLVFDEVQCGFGTTGMMWAYQHHGVVPDLIAFGKKAQVCGCCSTGRIDEIPANVFTTSGRINSTWGGNLVDFCRASIIMDIMREDELVANAATIGSHFLGKLQGLGLKNARGRGCMLAFDLETEAEREDVFARLNDKVLCLRCGPKSIRFRPALTFSKDDVDMVVMVLKSIL